MSTATCAYNSHHACTICCHAGTTCHHVGTLCHHVGTTCHREGTTCLHVGTLSIMHARYDYACTLSHHMGTLCQYAIMQAHISSCSDTICIMQAYCAGESTCTILSILQYTCTICHMATCNNMSSDWIRMYIFVFSNNNNSQYIKWDKLAIQHNYILLLCSVSNNA